ncbi:hypothetical protein [Novosphingopyxis sp. YJ-S2-01]|uniref:hypothetical protein n=1 Tax=Novosphingopyxis sp. YJ-S2-01 TaxID=2794021 RepID=UPI0018DDEF35|nr:hypothetical protein [Novosphingopyxis sp. YJ-S2-01]MBH9537515.1 hypothetical protein [Novosphingopyxis sp. YJ-S2-01]
MAAVLKKHSGETETQFRSRLARVKDLEAQRGRDLVNPFQEKQGDYRSRFVHHDETGTKTQTKVNRGGSSLERWIASGKFEQGEQKAIRHCQGLWERAKPTDHDPSRMRVDGQGPEGLSQQEALDTLSDYKRRIPSVYWSVFEDVARHEVAGDRAGLPLAGNRRSAIDAARLATGFCAGMIAVWEGF